MDNNQDSQDNVDHAAEVDTKATVQNFLELSDDEIANLSEAEFTDMMSKQDTPEATQETEAEPVEVEDEEVDEDSEPVAQESDKFADSTSTESEPQKEEPEDKEDSEEAPTDSKYKEVYDRLFNQPIRANGKDLKIRTVDDLIQLAQMGANYNLKMSGIKEQMPFLKILEKNDLLDERELSYLIDLKLGKPEAIARLLKENEVDLYDFDLEQSESYIPESRGVSHKEIELEDIIKEISNSPKFLDTMDVVQKTWDDGSRDMIREDPARLRIINEHMESGMYQKVWEEVERNQLLGNIPEGTSAIQAYDHYGTEMDKLGLLNEFSASPAAPSQEISTSTESQDIIKQAKQEALKDKKRAAVATTNKVTSNSGRPQTISPLSLSDEEFAKLGDPSLM